MRFETHTVISAVVPAALVVAAGAPVDLRFVLATTLAGVAIDLLDHPLYQLRFAQTSPGLRAAWALVRKRRVREALGAFKALEDSRSIDRLVFHSRGGLVVAGVVGLMVCWAGDDPVTSGCVLAVLLAMHCDIVSDVRYVGHVNNWFGRPTMHGTSSERWLGFLARRCKPVLTILYFPLWYAAGDAFFDAAGTAHHAGVTLVIHSGTAVIAAYLSAVALIAALAYRQVPGQERRLVARATGLREWFVVNHVAVAGLTTAAVALEVPAAVAAGRRLPDAWSSFAVALTVATVVLVSCLLVVYLVHSTGGALGGLAGSVLGVWTETAGHRDEFPGRSGVELAAILVFVLAGWALGLVFISMPGRRVTSAVVVSLSTPAEGDALARVAAVVETVRRSATSPLEADDAAGVPGGPASMDLSTWDGEVLLGRWGSTWSPMRQRSRSGLWPSLRADRAASRLPPAKTRLLDGGRQHTLSEVLDDLMTRRCHVEVRLLVPELTGLTANLQLRLFEGTSTKGYATATSEEMAAGIAAGLTSSSTDEALVGLAKFEQVCPYVVGRGWVSLYRDGVPEQVTPRAASGVVAAQLLRPTIRRGPEWRLGAVLLQTVTVLGGVASVAALLPARRT